MSHLLDTHAFLWSAMNPSALSRHARSILEKPDETAYVSVVTFWEISLKFALAKLDLEGITPAELPEVARQLQVSILPLEAAEAASYDELPITPHRDPFDRMLIWQAIRNRLTLISKDPEVRQYRAFGLKVIG